LGRTKKGKKDGIVNIVKLQEYITAKSKVLILFVSLNNMFCEV